MRDAPDVSYLKKFVSDLDVRTSETTEKSWLQLGCQFGSAQLFIPESKQHNIGILSQLTIHTHTLHKHIMQYMMERYKIQLHKNNASPNQNRRKRCTVVY